MWILIMAGVVQAADVVVDAQARPRVEAKTGLGDSDGTAFVTQRTRLGATLNADVVTVKAQMQDVRLWGSETNTLKDFSADGLDLHQGYIDIAPSDGFSIRLGRQEVTMHEHRLVGNVGWTSQARSFDGVALALAGGAWSSDVSWVVLPSENAAMPTAMAAFTRTGWHNDAVTADLVVLYDHEGATFHDRLTAGAYVKGGGGPFSARVEGYYQLGATGTKSIAAYMVGARATLAPDIGGKPSFTLWYDLLSGDLSPTDDTLGAFNTLFATNHKFYGRMDFAVFKLGGVGNDQRGLHDVALKLAAKPAEKVSAHLDAHVFMAATSTEAEPSTFGEEVDAWVGWKVHKHIGLSAGGAVWIPNEGQSDQWVWSMVDVKL
jgi:hypothetical protein